MRKMCFKIGYGFFLIMLAFLAVGCTTSVNVNTLVPADVNIGGEGAVIAIAPVTPFSSSSKYSYLNAASYYSDSVASYAGKMLEKSLSAGMYKVIDIKNTDSIVNASKTLFANPTENLLKAGATIYIQSAIENMECYDVYDEETRYNKTTKKNEIYVRVETYVSLTASFTVWDLRTQKILDTFTLTGDKKSTTGDSYKKTSSGKIESDPFKSSANIEQLYEYVLDGFTKKIRNRLVPHYETVTIELLENKTKNKAIDPAYKYAEQGELRRAYALFIEDWNRTGNTSSGCNAAILLYSMGDVNNALSTARDVYDASGSPDAYSILLDLQDLHSRENEALSQMSGSVEETGNSGIKFW